MSRFSKGISNVRKSGSNILTSRLYNSNVLGDGIADRSKILRQSYDSYIRQKGIYEGEESKKFPSFLTSNNYIKFEK